MSKSPSMSVGKEKSVKLNGPFRRVSNISQKVVAAVLSSNVAHEHFDGQSRVESDASAWQISPPLIEYSAAKSAGAAPHTASYHLDSQYDPQTARSCSAPLALGKTSQAKQNTGSRHPNGPARKPIPIVGGHAMSAGRKLTSFEMNSKAPDRDVSGADAAGKTRHSSGLTSHPPNLNHLIHDNDFRDMTDFEPEPTHSVKETLDNFRFDDCSADVANYEKQNPAKSVTRSPRPSVSPAPQGNPTWSNESVEAANLDPLMDSTSTQKTSRAPLDQHRRPSYRRPRPRAIIVPSKKSSRTSTVERKSSMESEIVVQRVSTPKRQPKPLLPAALRTQSISAASSPLDGQDDAYSLMHSAMRPHALSRLSPARHVSVSAACVQTSLYMNQSTEIRDSPVRYYAEVGGGGQSHQMFHMLSHKDMQTGVASVSPSIYSQSPSPTNMPSSRTSTSFASPLCSASSVTRMYKPMSPPVKIDIPSPRNFNPRSQNQLALDMDSPCMSPSTMFHVRSQSSGDISVPSADHSKHTTMTIGDLRDLMMEANRNEQSRRPTITAAPSQESLGITPRPTKTDVTGTLDETADCSYFSDTSGDEETWI